MSNATQKSGNSTLKWIFLGLAFIVLVTIISLGIKSCKVNHPKKVDSKTEKQTETVWVVTRTQTISINNEYSSTYYLSKGEGLSLKNSTQPYCVKNENSHCVCGEKGEDVTPKLPREDKNMELRFRTSNGEYGEITLVYWEKIIASNK